jgi:hypothetical protein
MGYSLSWLAVKGKTPQGARDQSGFRLTGEREEFPGADLSAVEIANGWYLIVFRRNELVASDVAINHLCTP